MKNIEIDSNNLQRAIATIPSNSPVLMLNLLRYKQYADYGNNTGNSCTGREAYFTGYIPAFNKIAANIPGIRPLYIGNAIQNLVAPADEVWDNVSLIEYPNFGAFLAIIQRPEYAADAEPHRLAALEDWRLIITVKANIL